MNDPHRPAAAPDTRTSPAASVPRPRRGVPVPKSPPSTQALDEAYRQPGARLTAPDRMSV
jgi:hypothetical protein